ncbi:hypothetical protein BaRGS_00023776 [Batillaria attramentaria]|uniref:Uncharacterized protein n=1 Tax=Batillaria attramentaria TaxID=370345 RepID=A0ABD0KD33_9CAEN
MRGSRFVWAIPKVQVIFHLHLSPPENPSPPPPPLPYSANYVLTSEHPSGGETMLTPKDKTYPMYPYPSRFTERAEGWGRRVPGSYLIPQRALARGPTYSPISTTCATGPIRPEGVIPEPLPGQKPLDPVANNSPLLFSSDQSGGITWHYPATRRDGSIIGPCHFA